VNFDFLYEWLRFGEVFMTILTDIGWDLLLNVDIGNKLALASLFLGTSSSASLQITCTNAWFCNSLMRHLWGVFRGLFLRDHANAQGVGPLCLKTRVSEKLKFLPPCASAHCASAVAEACKTPHFKSFLRASSQTIEMGSFAAIEIPIFNRWCCRHRFVTML
jgi:hypothetical protein